jgi:hypothetical protein
VQHSAGEEEDDLAEGHAARLAHEERVQVRRARHLVVASHVKRDLAQR